MREIVLFLAVQISAAKPVYLSPPSLSAPLRTHQRSLEKKQFTASIHALDLNRERDRGTPPLRIVIVISTIVS